MKKAETRTKIGENTQRNFTHSREILYWADRYETPVEEIQKIFNDSGNSISKTLETLRKRTGLA